MGKLSFGTTGLSYEVNKVDFNNSGGAPRCPRCTQRVYFNEEKKSLGKSWHKGCYSCALCKKSLDSTNTNGHNGEIYCTACHRREYGTKGYGFAGGAAGFTTETSTKDILYGRNRSRSSSSSSSGMISPKSPQMNGFSSSSGSSSLEQINNTSTTTANNHVNNATNNEAVRQRPAPLVDRNNMECCPRCGGRVYFAEEVKALKRKWHKTCFKCAVCQKMLDVGRCDGHQGEVYCTSCYGRSFGPKGYGYGVGVGTLSSEADPHRFYRSTQSKYRTQSYTAPPSTDNTVYTNESGVRRDLNGAAREWTEQQENVRHINQLAAELDQFE